jgi:hypothetical protein
MEKMSFLTLRASGLSINNTFSLIKSSVDISIPVQSYLGEIVNVALIKLIADNENFGEQINKNQKSGLTDDLKPLDKDRDDIEYEINRDVTYHFKGSDPAKKAAAQTLKLFLTPYWNAAKLPLNTQTGVISEMLSKYKASPELIGAAQILGIDAKFVKLEVKNNAFDIVYKNRNDEAPDHQISGSSLKPAAVESYNTFCTAMEQAVNLTPNDQLIVLFYKLDDFRKTYHALGGNGKYVPPTPEAPAK